jgi:hypothetical protein
MSCLKCSAVFSSSEVVAKCANCSSAFHPACTSGGSEQNFTKGKNKSWKCDQCKNTPASVPSKNTDVSGDKVDNSATILRAITSLKEDLYLQLDEKIGGVRLSIDQLTSELKTLNNKVTALEESQSGLAARCDDLERDKQRLADEARELRAQLRDQEQHSRCANVEITGLPYTQGEDIYVVVQRLAAVLGVHDYVRSDVSIAHRLRLYSKKHKSPPIIIQFVSRSTKEVWITAAKRKGSINAREVSAALQDCPVYINHHLTPHNKALLGRARRLQRDKKLNFAGYFNGKVLVRRKEGDPSVRMWELAQLDEYDK